MATLPWPRPSAAVANLPWIPPPPIYGLPEGNPPINECAGYPYYYCHHHGQPEHPAPDGYPDYYAKVSSALCGCQQWPRPADLPLPSVFPTPPSLLSSPVAAPHVFAQPPPPPQPRGWHTAPPPRAADTDSDDGEASSCSSCSECARVREARPRRALREESRWQRREEEQEGQQQHQQHQQRQRVAMGRARSVPPPRPRRGSEGRASDRQPPEQPQRFIRADPSEPPLHFLSRRGSRSTSTARRESSPSSVTSSSSSSANERLEIAATRAEQMLQRIDALYQKLRAGYEAFQRDPVQVTALSEKVGTAPPPPAAPPQEEGPLAGREASAPLSSAQRMPNTPQPRPAKQSAAAPPFPSGSTFLQPSSELRAQLLKLESQWKRLSELKTKGHTVGPHLATDATDGGVLTSSNSSSAHSSTFTGDGAVRPFESSEVLQLIRERKAVVGVS